MLNCTVQTRISSGDIRIACGSVDHIRNVSTTRTADVLFPVIILNFHFISFDLSYIAPGFYLFLSLSFSLFFIVF